MSFVQIIDDGAPQYDPRTQFVVLTWVDSEETLTDFERARDDEGNFIGPATRPIRTATYTVHDKPVTADLIAVRETKLGGSDTGAVARRAPHESVVIAPRSNFRCCRGTRGFFAAFVTFLLHSLEIGFKRRSNQPPRIDHPWFTD